VLDLIFATSFSFAVSEYFHNKDSNVISQNILDGLIHSPNAIIKLIPDYNYIKEDAISIMSHVFVEFPNIIVREFGVQLGTITGALELKEPNIDKNLPESWFNNLREEVLVELNRNLKLLKDD
jgi:hypothetical protein